MSRHRIRIFKNLETETSKLEAEVNQWLIETNTEVVAIQGNIAPQSPGGESSSGLGGRSTRPSDVLVVVHYLEPSDD